MEGFLCIKKDVFFGLEGVKTVVELVNLEEETIEMSWNRDVSICHGNQIELLKGNALVETVIEE